MTRFLAVALLALAPTVLHAAGPLSPREEQATFKLTPGFDITLAAAEPDVVDPVAMCFDEKGRLFVCEMRGYPNGGVGTGNETRGRIKCLTDADGDGVFETSHTFAEGLRFPMGVTPWKGGLLVAVAPDILYLEDTDGDGKADKSTVLYTGFNLANIQQMVNGLQWGPDNWVHGLAGSNGGTVRSPQKPDMPPVTLQSRGFRFKPAVPGSFEPTSGGGQYGITADDAGHWFTATNSQHLRQIVIPDYYLRRNPNAPVTAVSTDIPDHGASAKVFRLSPFEAWRVERTTRRAGSKEASRFATTELVPGGFTSSSCSPIVYTAELFPPVFRNNTLVCDPGNNLIHRDMLEPSGAIFTARRGDADCEFVASTDNWFRPVCQVVGPDGAVYVLDFYREVIETPLSLPDDIKAKLNLESRERGRVWRVAPTGFKPTKLPDLSGLAADQLADKLTDPNPWVRLTAQRLLVERAGQGSAGRIAALAKQSAGKRWLPNLLSMLREFGALTDEQITAAVADPLPGNREVGLRLAERRFEASAPLRAAAVRLANDPSPMVRFQAALSAGFLPPADAAKVLAAVVRHDAGDRWTQSAVLLSARGGTADLLAAVLTEPPVDAGAALQAFVTKAAAAVAAKGDPAELNRVLALLGGRAGIDLDFAVLEGVGQGTRGRKPAAKWATAPAAAGAVQAMFSAAVGLLGRETANPSQRVAAVRLAAFLPYAEVAESLSKLLVPQASPDLQLAAVRALAAHADPAVPGVLLKAWPQLGPSVRREVLEQLLATAARTAALLDAVEKGAVRAGEIEPARVAQMKAHPDASVRVRAAKLFATTGAADRKAVIKDYRPALELMAGDAGRGQKVFKTQCAACHKLGTDGHDVGPNLLATVPGKTDDDLLVALLDPNREVDPRYVNYLANTADGRVLTGIIVADTPAAVTLRRSEGGEDTVRRADLESLTSTGLSLMPEGLEKNLSKQDVADVFAFLRQAAAPAKK